MAREKYLVRGFPTTFLLDPEGKIVQRKVGFAPTEATQREKTIEDLLAKYRSKILPESP